jgi:hypothetical protein
MWSSNCLGYIHGVSNVSVYVPSPSTEIEWYPGKCLTQKVLKKKPKKGSKNTKPITKIENCESFFNFFSPPQVPDDEEEIDEDTVSSVSCMPALISET